MTADRLPPSWCVARLGALGTWRGGGTPSKRNSAFWSDGSVPWVSPKDMKCLTVHDTEDHITEEAVQASATSIVRKASVLVVTRSGILRHTLPVAVTEVPVAINQDLKALEPREGVDPHWVAWALRRFEDDILHLCAKGGTTVQSIVFPNLLGFEIPLPPTPEQRRIVAAIEEQFSRLDAGVESLHRARRNLQRLRTSILHAAATGRLVPQDPEDEPGVVLLKRVEEGRREAFDLAGRQYTEPTAPSLDGVPDLPDGWAWASLDALAEVVGGVTKDTKRESTPAFVEVPYLRVANVQRGHLDLSQVTTIRVPPEKVEQLRLRPGDVLFTEGGDRDKLGRGWVWEGQIDPCIHQNHIFRARLHSIEIAPRFVSWHGNTLGQQWFSRLGKQTTNLASVNLSTLKKFPVPVPPAAEQLRIIAEIDRHLSVIDVMEHGVASLLARSKQLRRGVLADAILGRLVPQDPSDEPASALLERIAAARPSAPSPARGRRAERSLL